MASEEKDFVPGMLVWGKVESHPWWPCVICSSPQTQIHMKTNKFGKQFHVQFFYNPPSRAWIKERNVKLFCGKDVPECKRGGMFYCSKKTYWAAVDRAEKAQFLTMKERLRMFGASYEDTSTEPQVETKKRKIVVTEREIQPKAKKPKIGPKSKIQNRDFIYELYRVGSSKIPGHWLTPYVLMNTNDIPEDLTPEGSVQIHNNDKESPVRAMPPQRKRLPIFNDEEEDDVYDSDSDPGWKPDTAKGSDDSDDDDTTNRQASDDDDDDESIVDSDEDPGWSPRKKKSKDFLARKPNQRFDKKKKNPKKKAPCSKPFTSLKTFEPKAGTSSSASASSKSPASQPSPTPIQKTTPTVTLSSPTITSVTKNVVIKDNTPTGPEPEVGDFLLEKAECKDGDIPFLWRFKKGGLIQKYEKLVENDQTFYENVQSFSDWWACYANKYQKVKTQIMYKYRNKEKVKILVEPVIEDTPEEPAPVSTSSTTPSTSTPPSSTTTMTIVVNTTNTQEQEISSTTPEPEFQIGQFVLDVKDKRNVDNFPIWKIESQILLKKYEAIIKNGKMLHRPVKTYRGYRDINKYYLSMKVKRVPDVSGDEFVEVSEDTKPRLKVDSRYVKVSEDTKPRLKVDSSMEDEYDKNPLLRHFYVYLQVFLSQALEPGFLEEVKKTKDETYKFPMDEVEKIIKQKCTIIERQVRWASKMKACLSKSPYLREVNKPDPKKCCEALADSEETVEEVVFLFGSEYDPDTLKQIGDSKVCQEFRIGKTAIQYIVTYHQLRHFKYNLYDKCLAKIKMTRDSSDKEMDVTDIMDSCLGNKAWVLQNFEDFMKLVEMS